MEVSEMVKLSTFTGNVVQALELASPSYCKRPATFIDSICQNNPEKTKNFEMRSNSQQIVLYCLGLYTHKPGLREVDLERSPKRADDKIKIQKLRRNTQKKASHMVQRELACGSQHLQRET